MSDLFFPHNSPSHEDMFNIMAIRYLPDPTAPKALFNVAIYSASGEGIVDTPTAVPSFYHDHLRRFLWRHCVYMELVSRENLALVKNLRPLLERYIFYMDAMVEGLLTTARNTTFANDPTFRSSLFSQYLVVEYHVGRHEFNVVGAWRQSNPDVILECVALDALDFDSFYRAADETDPTWSGVRYRFMYNKVNDSDWQTLADLAAKHFGLDIRWSPFVSYHHCEVNDNSRLWSSSRDKEKEGKGERKGTDRRVTRLVFLIPYRSHMGQSVDSQRPPLLVHLIQDRNKLDQRPPLLVHLIQDRNKLDQVGFPCSLPIAHESIGQFTATAVAGPSHTRQEQAQPVTAVVGESRTRQEHNPVPLPSISSNTNPPSQPTMPDVGPVTVPSRDDVDIAPAALPSRPPSAGPSRRPPAQSSRASSTIDPTPTIRMPDMSIMERAMGNNKLQMHDDTCAERRPQRTTVRNADNEIILNVHAPTTKVTVTTPITTQIVHDSDLHEPSPRDAGEEHDSESVFHSVHPRFNVSFRRSWDVGTYSSGRTSPEPELCSGPASPFIVPTDIESEWNTDEEDINTEVHPRIHRSLGRHWRPPPYDPGFAEFSNNDGIEWETEGRWVDEFDRSEMTRSPPPSLSPSSGISCSRDEEAGSAFAALPSTTPSPMEGLLVGCSPHTTRLCSTSTHGGLREPPDPSSAARSTLSILDPLRSQSESPETFNNLKSLLLVSEPQKKSTPLGEYPTIIFEKHSRDSAILDERRPFPSPKKGRKKSLGESESEGNVNMKVEGNSDPSSPYDFESVTLIVLSQKVNAEKEVEGRGVRARHNASTAGRSQEQRSIISTQDDARPSHAVSLRSSDPQHIKAQARALSSWLADLATLCERRDPSATSPHHNVNAMCACLWLLDGMDIIRHLDKNMDEMEHIKKELRSVYGTTGAVFHRSA
ncbi:hypothetical protein L210DRAFT_3509387 [Boletus edulis BED1]|uniref:Uncharacterized protein n=1 Tax=Boletus edulis BED1 TaxID=1328754 RepID=A0AAD4BEY8_BOLED|nr:hypothetical protein L210DRAFT_3509387 [Boletus edulis BED1]